MKIGWGWKIGILYGAFVVLIVTLVMGSSMQKMDLVAKDYYGEELAYQKVIDGSKNQSTLSTPIDIHATAQEVVLGFPAELAKEVVKGTIHFYCPTNAAFDATIPFEASNNQAVISRAKLHKTNYTIKVTYTAQQKDYYQETGLNLMQ
jgi:hypothetical protein